MTNIHLESLQQPTRLNLDGPRYQENTIPLLVPLSAMNRSITSTFKRKSNAFFSEMLWCSGTGLAPPLASDENKDSDSDKIGQDRPSSPPAPSNKVIVIHPGSQTWKFGFAKEPFPKHLENILAIKRTRSDGTADENQQEALNYVKPIFSSYQENANDWKEHVNRIKREYTSSFMPSPLIRQTRRSTTNTTSLGLYNTGISPTVIPAHNDAFRVEFSTFQDGQQFLCGDKVSLLPSSENSTLFVRHPIYRRRIYYPLLDNELPEIHCQDELAMMVLYGCQSLLDIPQSELNNYWAVLVIPDNSTRSEIKAWLNTLFHHCNFYAVLLVQKSLGAAYGSGCSSALIVDLGAEETSIAIVEDGVLSVNSSQLLGFGSDDLLVLFLELLKSVEFPYSSISLFNGPDLALLRELKERCWTLEDISEQQPLIVDFMVRSPAAPTLSYHFKAHEERLLPPLTYFNPSFLNLICRTNAEHKNQAFFIQDQDAEILLPEKTKKQLLDDNESAINDGSLACSHNIQISSTPNTSSANLLLQQCNYCRFCLLSDNAYQCCCLKGAQIFPKDLYDHICFMHLPTQNYQCGWITSSKDEKFCMQLCKTMKELQFHTSQHIVESISSTVDKAAGKLENNESIKELPLCALHESILKCILLHEGPDQIDKIRKWLCSILVIGSGHKITGFREFLVKKVTELALTDPHSPFSSLAMSDIETEALVSTITLPKDIDMGSLAWKGAGVIARVDASRESWISAKEWDALRMRSVIDRFPHIK